MKVTTVEIKDVEIPERMQHAMARQAEAERERRAKVINAEGEYQAAARLSDAAGVISQNPVTLQLRTLQALMEVGHSPSNTIVFPIPAGLLAGGAPATAADAEAVAAVQKALQAAAPALVANGQQEKATTP